MYRNDSTGFWEEDFRRKGVKRLHISYGVKKRADAEPASAAMHRIFREKRLELIERVRNGDVSPHQIAGLIADDKPIGAIEASAAHPWPALQKAVDDYVDWLKNNDRKSVETGRKAKYELKRFLAFIGPSTPVDRVTAAMVTDYQRQLLRELKANSVRGLVWRVSGLYTWLIKREKREAIADQRSPRVLHVPIDEDEITTRNTNRDRFLLEDEASRLVAATPTILLFPILCGLLAGMRIDEVVHLRPGFDVDVDLGLITVQEQPTWYPKNRKRRVIPMAPQLRQVARVHLAKYATEDWMLPSTQVVGAPMADKSLMRHFKRIVENAELVGGIKDPKGVVFHTLRHTFASWLVMRGVDLFTVSQLLGNSLKMVEKVYGHLAPDYRQRAVDRLDGVVAVSLAEEGPES